MRAARVQIADALMTLLQGAWKWNYTSKNFRSWTNFDPSNQPALFLRMPAESNQRAKGYGLQIYHQMFHVWIYARTDAPTVVDTDPYDSQIFPIIDAIDKTIHPVPGFQQTLGGLVNEVWITDVLPADGCEDGQIVILMTLVVESGS